MLSLTDVQKFEIAKIIIDKGLLAIVAAMIALMASYMIERYKSHLKFGEDISREQRSRLAEYLKSVDQFYQDAVAQVDTIRGGYNTALDYLLFLRDRVRSEDSSFANSVGRDAVDILSYRFPSGRTFF